MGELFDIMRRNRLYVFLLAFVVGVNLLVLAGRVGERPLEKEAAVLRERPAEKAPVEQLGVREWEEKLERLAAQNPVLYLFLGILNLLVLFVILVGLFLDVYFIARWARRKPISIRLVRQDRPRWGMADVARVVLIFLSCGYAFMIIQAIASRLFPVLHNENFRMVFNTAVMNVVGISVILYFVIRKHGQGVDAIGLTPRGLRSGVFYAAVGYVALVPVIAGIMMLTFFVTRLLEYRPPIQPIVRVFIEEKEVSLLWFSALFAAVFGPIAEEIFFRGFMYTAVRKRLGMFWAMVGTSAVFSFLHAHPVGFFPILALGMLLAYLYEKTGSLIPSISVHIMHNLAMVALVFAGRSVGGG